MPLNVNLRHLEAHSLKLEGELSLAELDIQTLDEVIRLKLPLRYQLEVEKTEGGLLVSGKLALPITCDCVRCLETFDYQVVLDPWVLDLPFEGEEAVVVKNDCVDLTPYLREDILLGFPQHPLCDPECGGLLAGPEGKGRRAESANASPGSESAWAELNKLKF